MLVGAVYVAELARVVLGEERLRRLLVGKYPWEGRVRGALLGAVLPFCECGAFPIMVALLRAGVPLGPVLTFFVVSPVLSLPTFAVMAGVFSLRLALVYLVMAVTGGVLAAYLLERVLGEGGALRLAGFGANREPCGLNDEPVPVPHACHGDHLVQTASCCTDGQQDAGACGVSPHVSPHKEMTTPVGIKQVLLGAWKPTRVTVITILPYSLIAMILAAALRTWLPTDAVSAVLSRGGPWGVVLAAVAGIPMYVGCTTAVSLAAPLMQATGAVGPGVAFIIAGAGTSVNGLVFMASIFTRRFISLFVASVFVLALLCGAALAALPWG